MSHKENKEVSEMYCEIDYCYEPNETTLTITTDDETMQMQFCKGHADKFEERFAINLGLMRHQVNLRKGTLPGNIGDVQQVIERLDLDAEIEARQGLKNRG